MQENEGDFDLYTGNGLVPRYGHVREREPLKATVQEPLTLLVVLNEHDLAPSEKDWLLLRLISFAYLVCAYDTLTLKFSKSRYGDYFTESIDGTYLAYGSISLFPPEHAYVTNFFCDVLRSWGKHSTRMIYTLSSLVPEISTLEDFSHNAPVYGNFHGHDRSQLGLSSFYNRPAAIFCSVISNSL